MALLFRRMGDGPHCEAVLREITAAAPSYLPAQADLVETLSMLGRREEARTLLQTIPEVQGIGEDLRRLRDLVGMG